MLTFRTFYFVQFQFCQNSLEIQYPTAEHWSSEKPVRVRRTISWECWHCPIALLFKQNWLLNWLQVLIMTLFSLVLNCWITRMNSILFNFSPNFFNFSCLLYKKCTVFMGDYCLTLRELFSCGACWLQAESARNCTTKAVLFPLFSYL